MKLQKMLLILGFTLFTLGASTLKAAALQASTSTHTIYIDNQETDIQAILIDGTNYIHMDDFAAMAGTGLEYLPDAVNITLTPQNKPIVRRNIDIENAVITDSDKKFTIQNAALDIEIDILKMNEDYYIRLTDAALLTDNHISYDLAEQLVLISTESGYDGVSVISYGYRQNIADMASYVKENRIPLQSLDKETTELDNYDIILLGEYHGNQVTYETELSMIQFLYENYGINNVFLETGYCDGVLLNQYIQTGDTAILDRLFPEYLDTFSYNQSNYNFFQSLYTYNQNLDDDKKLKLTGTDLQHQIYTGLYYLSTLLPAEEIPESLQTSLAFLNEARSGRENTILSIYNLLADMMVNEEAYRFFLGDAYEEFAYSLNSICQRLEYEAEGDGSIREAYMIENFIHQYNRLNGEKCVGIYGAAHTPLNETASGENQIMASHLNTVYPGRMAVIKFEYTDSYIINTDDATQPFFIPTPLYLASMKENLSQEPEFCKIDSAGSPFITNGTAKNHQYIIIINNSPAAIIYK